MRRFKTQEEIQEERKSKHSFGRTAFPTHKKLLIYARQSDGKGATNNKESYAQQTEELLAQALEYGWKQEDIIIFVENEYDRYGQKSEKPRDASGNLSIDERAALKLITQTIECGDVGAVMMWAVDRLTRDEDVIDGPVFAKLCRDYHVLLITRDDMFDFNNRKEDVDRFVSLAVEAKNYRLKHVFGRMLPARDRVAMRGEYCGHAVPTGLMLDDERKFYVANPVWSPIMKRLFKRFRELDADLTTLRREIYGKPIFPELPSEIQERVGQIHLTHVLGGYTIKSREGLKSMLTNAVYIGHAVYDGRIVKRNVHTAIVDEQDFFFALYALADTDLEGNIIERPQKAVRYEQCASIERTDALLAGTRKNGKTVLTSPGKIVYVAQRTAAAREAGYMLRDKHSIACNDFTINVSILDTLIEERVIWHVRPTLGSMLWSRVRGDVPKDTPVFVPDVHELVTIRGAIQDNFQAVQEQEKTKFTTVDNTIDELQRGIARLEREYNVTFDMMTDQEIRENRAAKARLVKRLDDVQKKQEREEQEREARQETAALLHSGTLHAQWNAMSIERKHELIRLVTEDIILEKVADNWLKLTIIWHKSMSKDAQSTHTIVDTAYILRRTASSIEWTDAENQIMRDLYETAPRMDILERLPHRTWDSMYDQAEVLGLSRKPQRSGTAIPSYMSLEDVAFIQKQGVPLDTPTKKVWWVSAVCNRETVTCYC